MKQIIAKRMKRRVTTPQSLLIDYVALGEPPGSNDFLFKMKVNDLSTFHRIADGEWCGILLLRLRSDEPGPTGDRSLRSNSTSA